MPPKHDRKMRELAVELFDEGYGRDIVAASLHVGQHRGKMASDVQVGRKRGAALHG